VILRDKDANTAWTAAADGTLEERRYYCQNWRADVSVILEEDGYFVERVKYSAYGTPFGLPAGDNDSDGDCDGTDVGRFFPQSYDIRFDLNLDGDNDSQDYFDTIALAGPPALTLGRGKLSRTDTANRKGYAGYENDGNLVRFNHVRHRVLDTLLGRWSTRDPLEALLSGQEFLYLFCRGQPLTRHDSTGLRSSILGGCEALRPVPGHIPESNGCGAGPLNPYIPERPFWIVNFAPCCDQHDLCYDTCNPNRSQEQCDDVFCSCTRNRCRRVAFRTECEKLAEIYCWAVETFGHKFYPAAQENACMCCDPGSTYSDFRCLCLELWFVRLGPCLITVEE
jgi:RHS repeat-associated protein